MLRSREDREIGKDQHLTFGMALVRDDQKIKGLKEEDKEKGEDEEKD